MEVFGIGRHVEEAGEDLALHGGLGDLVLGADAVGGVVAGAQFAQLDFTQSNQRRTKTASTLTRSYRTPILSPVKMRAS